MLDSIIQENNNMWQCDCCKCKVVSHNGFVTPQSWDNAKVCFTCHWFQNPLAVANRGASFVCSECATVPCETHAPAVAMSFALSALQQLRRERFIPTNAPVSREEHDYAVSVERSKLQEFKTGRCDKVMEEIMETDDMIMQEPTMVERSAVAFPVIQDAGITARVSANKRSATVTPCPEEARGRCAGCHAPVEYGKAFCGPCFLASPDGRAKRVKVATEKEMRVD